MKIELMKTKTPRNSPAAFTLVELMVVVVILSILAVTILPKFIGTTYDAKVSTAKSNVAELQSAVERFYIHMDRYPTTQEGLEVLIHAPAGSSTSWHGPYIERLRPDPWGNAYQYLYPGTHNPNSYDIWSRGADGVDGGTDKGADIGNW